VKKRALRFTVHAATRWREVHIEPVKRGAGFKKEKRNSPNADVQRVSQAVTNEMGPQKTLQSLQVHDQSIEP